MIDYERSTRTLNISQSQYILDYINSFGLSNSKTFYTRLDGYSGILFPQDGEALTDESANAITVAYLLYASLSIRPDISFALS